MLHQSSTLTLHPHWRLWLLAVALVAASGLALPVPWALAQTAPAAASAPVAPATSGDSREEILKTFQREAYAAYAEAQKACQSLPEDPRKICLAKARLQFDEDMRYAQMRADMGY